MTVPDPVTVEVIGAALASIVEEMGEALVRASGLAALIATHNLDIADRMDRRITLQDGKIEEI